MDIPNAGIALEGKNDLLRLSQFSRWRRLFCKLQFIGEMRGETRVGNFSRKASPHPSKAFKKGINFTNLVLLNDERHHFLL